ncbi:MAG: flippase-like domain-containing protein [Bryobacteraceae bacterium]|nr:flippase-like domain-containing protein [Bryobacteraceae bacterium]
MTEEPSPKKRASNTRKWLVAGAVAAVVAAFVAHRWRESGFEWSKFTAVFATLNLAWLTAAVGFALLTYVGRALRWQVLLRPVKSASSFWNVLSATVIGFSAIVLFGRAGEALRPYLIAVKEKVPFSSQVGAWLIERIWDLLTALLIFGFALTQMKRSGAVVGPRLEWVLRAGGWVAGLLALLCLLVLFFVGRFSGSMRERLLAALTFLPEHIYDRARGVVTAFTHGMGSTGQGRFLWLLAFYSLLEWFLIVGSYVCLFQAAPATASLSLTDILIFVGFASFGAVVQIPGIGGGIQLTVIVVLTELFGISLEASSGMAVLLWLTTFVVIAPVGLLLACHEGFTIRRLRKMEEEAAL